MTLRRKRKSRGTRENSWFRVSPAGTEFGFFPNSKQQHYDNVARVGCVITGSAAATIHHCHGGSMRERLVSLGMDATKGMGMRGYSDALIIPLRLDYHSMGINAIDGQMGVATWEKSFGNQADLVDYVGVLVGYSLWELHAQLTNQKFKRPSSTG